MATTISYYLDILDAEVLYNTYAPEDGPHFCEFTSTAGSLVVESLGTLTANPDLCLPQRYKLESEVPKVPFGMVPLLYEVRLVHATDDIAPGYYELGRSVAMATHIQGAAFFSNNNVMDVRVMSTTSVKEAFDVLDKLPNEQPLIKIP